MVGHFNIPFFLFPFSRHKEIKKDLINLLKIDDGKNFNSNQDQITKTDWFIGKQFQDKTYYKLLKENKFIEEIDNNFSNCKIGPWKIVGLWYQIYGTNDKHNWHKHGECQWSFVYYVNMPKKSKGTVCLDMITLKEINLNQTEGDIFIFPSMITHCSPINNDKDQKIIIAGNIDVN